MKLYTQDNIYNIVCKFLAYKLDLDRVNLKSKDVVKLYDIITAQCGYEGNGQPDGTIVIAPGKYTF